MVMDDLPGDDGGGGRDDDDDGDDDDDDGALWIGGGDHARPPGGVRDGIRHDAVELTQGG